MGALSARELDKQITIERKVNDKSFDRAGSASWVVVEKGVWAGVKDMLPSRGEKVADGIDIARRPARVRMRYREDVTPDMRFVMGSRIMEIVAGPAEIGTREGIEFMVEDRSTRGGGA